MTLKIKQEGYIFHEQLGGIKSWYSHVITSHVLFMTQNEIHSSLFDYPDRSFVGLGLFIISIKNSSQSKTSIHLNKVSIFVQWVMCSAACLVTLSALRQIWVGQVFTDNQSSQFLAWAMSTSRPTKRMP